MKDVDQAFRQCLADLKSAMNQVPELATDYAEQAWGVFGMWLCVAGYLQDDENDTIADMRKQFEKLGDYALHLEKNCGIK